MMNALKFAPFLVAVTIGLTVYFARAKRLLVTAVWLALGLGFVMTRLMHAAQLPGNGTTSSQPGTLVVIDDPGSSADGSDSEVADYAGR